MFYKLKKLAAILCVWNIDQIVYNKQEMINHIIKVRNQEYFC